MRIACVAFTSKGLSLACQVRDALAGQGGAVGLWAPDRLARAAGTDVRSFADVRAWAAEAWAQADALLFVGACGIAVRAVAPLVADKFLDPAVVCVDEAGTFAVPLVGGHVGGANELARRVGGACGATAVVTTATDVSGVFAVDAWARSEGLAILDRDEAKRVSATLLAGGTVGFASDFAVVGEPWRGVVPCDGEASPDVTVGIAVSHDCAHRPFAHTLRLAPRTAVVGVGCRRGTGADAILALVDACLREARVAPEAVCAVASVDAKADEEGLLEAARRRGWPTRFYDATRLAAVPGDFASSDFVLRSVGVDNVCERAACADGARLLLGKRAADGVTVAVAVTDPALRWPEAPGPATPDAGPATPDAGPATPDAGPATPDAGAALRGQGVLHVVGIGPGGADDMTLRAHKTLLAAEVIVGYTTYIGLVRDAYPQAEFVATGMRGEVRRCRLALERAAQGRRVAMVCSGDAGVYGMAGLLLELAPGYPGVEVRVVPGVTAATGGAALVGAPLTGDWCSVSLSDLLTPWPHIEARLRAAARAGFAIALYNPASRGRQDHLRRACDVLLECLDPLTPCGIARNVGRDGETSAVLTLAELREARVDMRTCVFVGNASTRVVGGRMVTPRGYAGVGGGADGAGCAGDGA